MEESPLEQQRASVKRLANQAGVLANEIEDTRTREALTVLISGVSELAGEPSSMLHFELSPSALETLSARIEAAGEKRFIISFPEVELSITDIWHEEAPDDPTAEDVAEVMREQEHSSPNTIVSEWCLLDEIHIRRSDRQDEPVVFDG
jgi:hypothetical protein